MSRVVGALSMSLDGFVAHDDDSVGHLFDWYENGDVEVRWPGMGMVSHVSAASAVYLQGVIDEVGAIVVGRRVYDYTSGWGGDHPLHVPLYLVTHHAPDSWPRDDAPYTAVTEGVAAAIGAAACGPATRRLSWRDRTSFNRPSILNSPTNSASTSCQCFWVRGCHSLVS